MHLARFPRVRLFPAPTPLERLDNLANCDDVGLFGYTPFLAGVV